MARLIRALLDALDDDGAGTASSLSSGASSPSRSLSPPDALAAAPRVAAQLSSSSATDDDVGDVFDGSADLGDEVLEEVSNGFFRVARVPPRPSDEGPTSSGDEKPAAGSASASESEYFGAAVEGSSEEGFAGARSVAVDVFDAGATSGLEGAASVVVGGNDVGVDGSLDGSFHSSRSVLEGAALGDLANHSDGSVMNNGEQGGQGVAAKAVSDVVSEHFIGDAGGINGGGMRSIDASEGTVGVCEREVAALPPVVDSTEEYDAGLVLLDDDSDAKNNTAKHEVITYVEDVSPEHAANDDSDAKDNPHSTVDGGHNKVDGETQSDSETSASVPISETNKTRELLQKELEDKVPASEDTCFGLDDLDADQVNDDDDEEELFFGNDDEEELNGKEVDIFDYAALAELLRAANISPGQGKAEVFPVETSESRQLPPTVVSTPRTNVASTSMLKVVSYPESEMTDEEKKLYRNVDMARIKYLRLVHRLGYDTKHRTPKEVLYRLSIVEGFRRVRIANHSAELENAWKRALQLEAEGIQGLKFSCNVLVLGKTGVGKSATINSIFDEDRSKTNAFLPATSSVKEIAGVVCGVKFRVIDTPGLGTTVMDEKSNRKVLSSVKKYIKRCPPDIVLYVDRIDTQRQDADDLFLLRVVTSVLGLSIWSKTIITLTHSAAPPPEGPSGSPMNYEMFVTHRTCALQQSIWQATKDTQIQNRVALVENHHLCRRNSEGEKVLPDGTMWRRELLLLCYSLKIVPEIDSLSTRCAASTSLFGLALKMPPLPCFLSSLLKSREHPRCANCRPDDELDTDRSPIADLALPSSFDSDDPVYRYRCLEPTPNLLVRADTNPDVWDHDCGFGGVSLQHSLDVVNSFPASLCVQVNKDKKEFTIRMESSISAKHRGHASSLAGFDIQTTMDQLAYTLRGETKFKNFKKNTTTGGLSMTFWGDTMVTGAKFEDKLSVGNRLTLVANTGAVTMKDDTAYGVNMEASLHEKEYPMGQGLATLGASLVRWHREWSVAANLDYQFSVGRNSSMAVHLHMNNKLTGRVSIKANTSEQLKFGLLGICSTAIYLWNRMHPCSDPNYE